MASGRYLPLLLASGVGVVGGIYIWNAPLQELSGKGPASEAPKDGRSQSAKDGTNNDGTPSAMGPHTPLREGGSASSSHNNPTVAGTSAESRKGYSADHNVQVRSNPNVHDGTSGGGVGVAEMRERKMAGQGLPSPQGGDTPAKPVMAVANEGEMGGTPKKSKWWLGGW